MNGGSMCETPNFRLCPVTIDLACPDHGHVQQLTVIDLQAQKQWTHFFQERHAHRHACTRTLETTVPVE